MQSTITFFFAFVAVLALIGIVAATKLSRDNAERNGVGDKVTIEIVRTEAPDAPVSRKPARGAKP